MLNYRKSKNGGGAVKRAVANRNSSQGLTCLSESGNSKLTDPNKIGNLYSLEYTDIPKGFFKAGRCCSNVILIRAGHETRTGVMGNAYNIFVGKPKGKTPLGRRPLWSTHKFQICSLHHILSIHILITYRLHNQC
jgi:hypothetical protein